MVDTVIRFLKSLKGASWIEGGVMTLYAVAFVIVAVTPQKRYIRDLNNLAWMRSVAEEIKRFQKMVDGETIEIGYGSREGPTYAMTFMKPILVFAGNPVSVDGWSDMELRSKGHAVPSGKLQWITSCKTQNWLIAKGQSPFSMNGFYEQRAFWPEIIDAFWACYRFRASREYFDLWSCRPDTEPLVTR